MKKTRERFVEKPLPPPDPEITSFEKLVIPGVISGYRVIEVNTIVDLNKMSR
jgi:hypothetical protein